MLQHHCIHPADAADADAAAAAIMLPTCAMLCFALHFTPAYLPTHGIFNR
jgi:hypothetical protein